MIVNMDAAASTPLGMDAAVEMIKVAQRTFWNPSSHHTGGYEAQDVLKKSRESIASSINAYGHEIYFTSGGTESDNWAIESLARWGNHCGKKHILSTTIEHHAILNKLKRLEKRGFEVELVSPNYLGFIDPEDFRKRIRKDTCFASVMFVNNELGVIQPVDILSKYCHDAGVLFHTDAVQAIPHIVFDMKDERFKYIDMFSVSAHKFNGPRGVGFLYVKSGTPLAPLIVGGAHENGKRAGTENLPGIVGMSIALRKRVEFLSDCSNITKLEQIRKTIINGIHSISGIHFNTQIKNTIPNIINFYIEGIKGEVMLSLLNSDGVYCSAGSACAAGDPEPSHVLKAIGLGDECAANSIRLSFDYDFESCEADYVIESIRKNVKFLRGESQ